MASIPTATPHAEYSRRLDERRSVVDRAARSDGRFSLARGVVFLAGVGLLIAALAGGLVSPWWLPLPAAAFVVLVLMHRRVVDRLERARRAVAYYHSNLDRLEDRWTEFPTTGQRYADPNHLYSGDLDVFGRGSLFQLLSTARTRLGEDKLAEWLSSTADRETVVSRQSALRELRDRLDLRENLALLDADVREHFDQNRLLQWSQEAPQPVSRGRRAVAVLLGATAVAALAAWIFLGTGPSPFVVVLIVEALFTFTFRKQIKHLAKTADEAGSGLAILSQVLALIESERFTATLLARLRARLDTEGLAPSRRIEQLHGLIQNLNNSLQNQFFAPIAFVLCLPIHFVHAVEKWRERVGTHIPEWLESVGEFEALSALAGYAYEHPSDAFPVVVEAGPCFDGEQVGHPLIPDAQCVRNDLALGDALQLMLVSGSNMSGKSTLLRTIGTNVVLALVGAPARAKRLRLSTLNIGTAMRVNDSLLDGKSLFYASLSRLKEVVELSDAERPLLFLLDEILQGTNSHDRRVGAEGIIRSLVGRGAIGLVTTHDLALTKIAESLGSRAKNVHFEDRLVDGRMSFDYRLRPGVVERSNALELMRLMGLQVQDVSSAIEKR